MTQAGQPDFSGEVSEIFFFFFPAGAAKWEDGVCGAEGKFSYSVGNRLSKECNQVEIAEVKKERTLMK